MDTLKEEDEEEAAETQTASSGGHHRRKTIKKEETQAPKPTAHYSPAHSKSPNKEENLPSEKPQPSKSSHQQHRHHLHGSTKSSSARSLSSGNHSSSTIQAIRSKPASSLSSEHIAVLHKKQRHSFRPGAKTSAAATVEKAAAALLNKRISKVTVNSHHYSQPSTPAASSAASSREHSSHSKKRQQQQEESTTSPTNRHHNRHDSHSPHESRSAHAAAAADKSGQKSNHSQSLTHKTLSSSSSQQHHPGKKSKRESDKSRHSRKTAEHTSRTAATTSESDTTTSRSHITKRHAGPLPAIMLTSSLSQSNGRGGGGASPLVASHSEYDTEPTRTKNQQLVAAAAGHQKKSGTRAAGKSDEFGTSADELLFMTDPAASSSSVDVNHTRPRSKSRRQTKSTPNISGHHSELNRRLHSLSPNDVPDVAKSRHKHSDRRLSRSKLHSKVESEEEVEPPKSMHSQVGNSDRKSVMKKSSHDVKRKTAKISTVMLPLGASTTDVDEPNSEQDDEEEDQFDSSNNMVKRKKRSRNYYENVAAKAKVTPELAAFLLETLHSGLGGLKARASTTPSLEAIISTLVDNLHRANKSANLHLSSSQTSAALTEVSERVAVEQRRANLYRQTIQKAHALVLNQLRPPKPTKTFCNNNFTTILPPPPTTVTAQMEQLKSLNDNYDDSTLINDFEHDLSSLINSRNCEILCLRQEHKLQNIGVPNGGGDAYCFASNPPNSSANAKHLVDQRLINPNSIQFESKISELNRECSDKAIEIEHYQKLAATWRAELDRQCEKLRDVESLQTKLKSKEYEVERLRMQLEARERATNNKRPTSVDNNNGGVCRLAAVADAKNVPPQASENDDLMQIVNQFCMGNSGATREADVKAAVRLGEAKRRIKQLQNELMTLDAARRLFEKRCNELVEQVGAARSQTSQVALQLETAKQTVAEVRLENERLSTLGVEQQKKYAQEVQALRAEYKRMKVQFHTLEREHDHSAEEARQKHERLHDAQVELKQLEAQLRALNHELNVVSAEADKRQRVADEVKQQLQALDERLVERDTTSVQLRDQIRAAEAEMWAQKQRREQTEQAAQETTLEKKRIQQQLQEHRTELDKKRQELTFMEGQANEYKTQLDELESCIHTQFDELVAHSQRQIKQATSETKRLERKGNCLERAVNVVVSFILSGTVQRRILLQRPPIRKLLPPSSSPQAGTEPPSDEQIAHALGINVGQLHEAARLNPNVRTKLSAMVSVVATTTTAASEDNNPAVRFDSSWPPRFVACDIEQCRVVAQQLLIRIAAEKVSNVDGEELSDTLSRFLIQLVEASVLVNVPLPTSVVSSTAAQRTLPGNNNNYITQQFAYKKANENCSLQMENVLHSQAPSVVGEYNNTRQQFRTEKIGPIAEKYQNAKTAAAGFVQNISRKYRDAVDDNDELLLASGGFAADEEENNKNNNDMYRVTTLQSHHDFTNSGFDQSPHPREASTPIDNRLLVELATAMLATPQTPTNSGTCNWASGGSVHRQFQQPVDFVVPTRASQQQQQQVGITSRQNGHQSGNTNRYKDAERSSWPPHSGAAFVANSSRPASIDPGRKPGPSVEGYYLPASHSRKTIAHNVDGREKNAVINSHPNSHVSHDERDPNGEINRKLSKHTSYTMIPSPTAKTSYHQPVRPSEDSTHRESHNRDASVGSFNSIT